MILKWFKNMFIHNLSEDEIANIALKYSDLGGDINDWHGYAYEIIEAFREKNT